MPKYRIVKRGNGYSNPRSIWLDKATDDDVLQAAKALLRQGEFAEVWSETALIRRIQPRAMPRTRPRAPTVLAGLATATILALMLFTVHSIWLNAVSSQARTPSSTEARDARDLGYAIVMDAVSSPVESPAPSNDALTPAADTPTSIKQARRNRSNTRVASEPGPPRTALFPAVPQARTNIYEMVGSGFPQGGN